MKKRANDKHGDVPILASIVTSLTMRCSPCRLQTVQTNRSSVTASGIRLHPERRHWSDQLVDYLNGL